MKRFVSLRDRRTPSVPTSFLSVVCGLLLWAAGVSPVLAGPERGLTLPASTNPAVATPATGTVTLTGNNFLGMTGVTFFRSVTATTFTVVSDTQMTVVVPTGAKTGVITLTNGLGTNTTSKFTVTP